jgi:predicted nucleic acid-binding protein
VELKKKGKPIQTNDIWIAAIAKVHDLILITNDSGFRYISDLEIEDWTKPIDKNLKDENL